MRLNAEAIEIDRIMKELNEDALRCEHQDSFWTHVKACFKMLLGCLMFYIVAMTIIVTLLYNLEKHYGSPYARGKEPIALRGS